MAPFSRLKDTESIPQRFWRLRARNPTCGLIGWERGTLIFAWGNIILGANDAILCSISFLIHFFLPAHKTSPPNDPKIEDVIKNMHPDLIEKPYGNGNRRLAVAQAIVFFAFLFSVMWCLLSWKLKKAAVERQLPKLKKYYAIMLALSLVGLAILLWGLEMEFVFTFAFLIILLPTTFQITGLMFTHGYIASLSSPHGGDGGDQPEDLNRFQFNP